LTVLVRKNLSTRSSFETDRNKLVMLFEMF
jgi:hypothetical protein